jgi:hypothetical protein
MAEMRNVMRVKRTPEEEERDFNMLRKWFSLKDDKFGDKREEEFVLLQRAKIGLDRFKLPGDEEKAVKRAIEYMRSKELPLGLHRPEWMGMLKRPEDARATKGVPLSILGKFGTEFGARMEAPEIAKKQKRRVFE